MERDFRYFIERYSDAGAREKFEHACYILLKRKYKDNVYQVRENPGDEGIDIFVGDFNDSIDLYQCKFFMKEIDYKQINKSFDKAINNTNYSIKSWNLLIPKKMDAKEIQKWFKWKRERESSYNIKITAVDQNEIIYDMKELNLYDQIFDIEPRVQLKYIYEKAIQESLNSKKNVEFIINIIINYIEKRINFFKELYNNSFDIKNFFKKNKISSFQEFFTKSSIEDQFMFNQIPQIISKIETYSEEIAYLCKEYTFLEKVYVDDIEKDVHYSDSYLFSIKGEVFEVILLKIISNLEKEDTKIKNIIKSNYENISITESEKLDLRDNIILYDDDILELLSIHILDIYNKNPREGFECFYGKSDTQAIEFALVCPDMRYSNSKIPFPTSLYKMIEYIDKKYSKLNEYGTYSFSLETTNIFFLEELDLKTLNKLQKIKNKSNLKYHFFIKKPRYSKYLCKNNIDEKEIKVVSSDTYKEKLISIKDKVELLVSSKSDKIPNELKLAETYDGIVITNGRGFVLRKRKSNK